MNCILVTQLLNNVLSIYMVIIQSLSLHTILGKMSFVHLFVCSLSKSPRSLWDRLISRFWKKWMQESVNYWRKGGSLRNACRQSWILCRGRSNIVTRTCRSTYSLINFNWLWMCYKYWINSYYEYKLFILYLQSSCLGYIHECASSFSGCAKFHSTLVK